MHFALYSQCSFRSTPSKDRIQEHPCPDNIRSSKTEHKARETYLPLSHKGHLASTSLHQITEKKKEIQDDNGQIKAKAAKTKVEEEVPVFSTLLIGRS
jgi:hypothetical protein